MMNSTRRELLGRLRCGLQFLPALALAPRSLFNQILFEPDGEPAPALPLPQNPFIRNGRSLVAVVHGHHVPEMLRAGLDLIGGLDRLALGGKRVVVKPNVVNDRPPPTTTNPEVVRAVVEAVRRNGAADVVVADSSGVIRFPTSDNLVATGIRATAEAAGARALSLDDGPWLKIEPEGAESLTRVYVSKTVYEADVFINVPVVKTHRFAHYSCSLKNLVGIVHPRNRPSVTFLAGNWHERIAEINLAVHPQLTIADATTVMIAGGPTSGTPAKANLLLLSGDRVALDAVAVALIRTFGAWDKVTKQDIWSQRQIKRAGELGLGARNADDLELVTASVSGPDERFDRLIETIRTDLRRPNAS